MRENFSPALAFTLGFEGGYVNHPKDPGGHTNKGITLATLRQGDDWYAKGEKAAYRWWSKNRPVLAAGDHLLETQLGHVNWIPVSPSSPHNTPELFEAAKVEPRRVGFTFGGTNNAGHGVCLTSGSAAFVVRSFTTE